MKYRLTGMPKSMDMSAWEKQANKSKDPLAEFMRAARRYNTFFNTPHSGHRIEHWEIGVIEVTETQEK